MSSTPPPTARRRPTQRTDHDTARRTSPQHRHAGRRGAPYAGHVHHENLGGVPDHSSIVLVRPHRTRRPGTECVGPSHCHMRRATTGFWPFGVPSACERWPLDHRGRPREVNRCPTSNEHACSSPWCTQRQQWPRRGSTSRAVGPEGPAGLADHPLVDMSTMLVSNALSSASSIVSSAAAPAVRR